MTLNQLRTFIAVSRHSGFSAAARMLKMRRSTLVSQIQSLEEEHGVLLFERKSRGLQLTDTGFQLLQFARRMVELEDDAAVMLKDSVHRRGGSLKVGAVSPFHVIDMIQAFNASHPGVYLSVTTGNSETILRELESYGCDVGVLARETRDDRYFVQHYASFPVMAFVHRDHRLARQAGITLEQLAGEGLLMRERGSTTRRALEEGMKAAGFSPRVAMEIGSREAIREAVIRGLGIGTVSESEYVPDEHLHPLPITDATVLTHIYACCLRERLRSTMIADFFSCLKDISPAAARGSGAPGGTAKAG